jgi:hypothetical protein
MGLIYNYLVYKFYSIKEKFRLANKVKIVRCLNFSQR